MSQLCFVIVNIIDEYLYYYVQELQAIWLQVDNKEILFYFIGIIVKHIYCSRCTIVSKLLECSCNEISRYVPKDRSSHHGKVFLWPTTQHSMMLVKDKCLAVSLSVNSQGRQRWRYHLCSRIAAASREEGGGGLQ